MKRAPISCVLGLVVSFASLTLAERPTAAGPASPEELKAAWIQHQEIDAASPFAGLNWRCVGPVIQGGRVVDIEVVPGEPYSFYVAYASGGLWKTTNNGVTFEPLFDEQPTMIMGDIAIDPQNPEVIWVGTGENNSSRSSYGGMGVLRSDDGGKTWQHLGLTDTDRIGRIQIDPRDSQRVFVAALGKLYTPGGLRGVYRTVDGGQSWTQVLAGDDVTGFVDLAIDPENPDVLFAAAWERSRRPWNFVEGGEGSGIYKSEDGGETWMRLKGGFPEGEHVGRIGLAVFAGDSKTLYASIDNQEPLPEELWDLGGGAVTAKRLRSMSKEEFLRQDPDEINAFIRSNGLEHDFDVETLTKKIESDELTIAEVLETLSDANSSLFETDIRGLEVWRSDDSGETWRLTHDEPLREVVHTYGYYFGQIRVSPSDVNRVYVMGVPVVTSADGGQSWYSIDANNMHGDHQAMWIDPQFPDRIIAGNDGGINMSFDGGASWLRLNKQEVGQFYAITVDMDTPYNIYGGLQDNGVLKGSSRWKKSSSQPWRRVGGGDGMYVQVDPRDGTTYWGFQFGNYFRVDPKGGRAGVKPRNAFGEEPLRFNWQTPIQLSAHNPDIVYFGANKLFRSMDKGETWTAISEDLTTSEDRGDVPFPNITTISESEKKFGLIWAGTDDGKVWLTQDGGVEWQDLSDFFPADRWVSRVEASHHDEQVAHVSLNGYRDDDIEAYLYRTEDLGESWKDISGGLPDEAINVVREDPVNANVLYVGTDRGAYVSLDKGATWTSLSGGLPNVPVHDLIVHPRERELVAGTHGRSIWVLDVLPIQELTPELQEKTVWVFPKEDITARGSWKSRRSRWYFRESEVDTFEIPFWVRDGGTVTVTLKDGKNRPLRIETLEAVPGVNTFVWDYLLDEKLAVAAEMTQLQADKAEKPSKKKRSKSTKKETGASNRPETSLANKPWQEAVRLGRPLYVTPGSYSFEVSAGEAAASTTIKVKAPRRWNPPAKKELKIRAQKEDRK